MKDVDLAKRLEWIGRKVASKDAAYPFRRLSYSLRKRRIDRRFPTSRQARHALFNLSSSDSAESLVEHFQGRSGPRWHFQLSEIDEIVARIPAAAKDRTVAEAEQIVSRRFAIIGYAPVKLDPMDWEYSPNGGVAWTRDLNRHACFETLGFAYRYTSDERFARTFVELSNSWIDQIAGRIGRLQWDTPFQLARRLNSWIWAFFLFLGSPSWKAVDQKRFLSTVGVLAEYLYQTIEYHSPGNHILLEAKALALCGEIFPEFEGAGRWRTKGWGTLSREIPIQVCEDGVHAERATMYHRAIAGELAELWVLCSRNELPPVRTLAHVVQQMAEFQRWIDFGDGRYPLFGDSLAKDTYYRFSAPVIMAAGSGTLLPLEEGVADHTWWVLDWDVARAQKHSLTQNGARAFPEGGYYVSRSWTTGGTNVLVWNCGSLGYDENRKHGHADALSIVLSVGGEPLLVDPGQGAPHGEGSFLQSPSPMIDLVKRWRVLRTTSAHNTISVDGMDQAVLGARNEIWNPPEPVVILWQPSETHDVMWGRHDGYRRLRNPVIHDRLIVACHEGYWVILDQLSGVGVHTAEIRYHFSSRALLGEAGPSQFRIRKAHAEVLLTLLGPRDEGSSLVLSEDERIGELRDGHPEVIPVLCGSYKGSVPFVLCTFLAIPGAWEMRLSEVTGGRCVIEAANQKKTDRIIVQFGGDGFQPGIDIARHVVHEELIRTWIFEPRADQPVGEP